MEYTPSTMSTPTYRFCFWNTIDEDVYAALCKRVSRDEISRGLLNVNICGLCKLNLLKVLNPDSLQMTNKLSTTPQMRIFNQKFDKSRPCELMTAISNPQKISIWNPKQVFDCCHRCLSTVPTESAREWTNPFTQVKRVYCRACYKESLIHMKCYVCDYKYEDFITDDSHENGKWTMTATGMKFCPGCSKIEDCSGCGGRISTGNSMVVERRSGQVWCGECFVKNLKRIDGCLVKLTKQVTKEM